MIPQVFVVETLEKRAVTADIRLGIQRVKILDIFAVATIVTGSV